MSNIYHSNIGAAALIALQDGRTRWSPGDILRPEVQPDLTPYAALIDPDGTMEMSMTVYLIESEGSRVLVDTGLADQEMPRRSMDEHSHLLECLEEADVSAASIDFVVHTHLHFDHVGWNTYHDGSTWEPTFPNAKHLIQQRDWEHWVLGPQGFPGPDIERSIRPLENAEMIKLLDGDHSITTEVSVVAAYGHTPGHQVVRVNSNGAAAYILGDSCHIAMQVCETNWSDRADVDHVEGNQSRAMLMQRIDDEDAIVIGGHFPFPGLGRRVTRAGQCAYEPIT